MKKKHSLLLGISFSMGIFIFGQGNASAAENVKIKEDVYQEAVNANLLETSNGKVKVKDKKAVEKLSDNTEEYKDFQETVDSINHLVDENVATINKEFDMQLLSPEEVQETAHKSQSNQLNNQFSTLAVDPGIESLNLKGLVESNRKQLEKFHDSLLKTAPNSAYNTTVGYFVGKVQEGGPWDYKVKTGYKPWYKEFNASTYDGKKVITSEYIGNYNYAYTGEFLFSKKTLLIGGGAVGTGVGQPEDAKDRNTITKGFNDAVKYW
ncbi:polymorphic toxin type 44 domain-containing protein [Priestia endophytica]|uniref:polymorphic toxin type 44 domain-containing protein n=1 Tax=Priestia endophytica TaxID=135735 RepID=UPI001559F780|nr:polymorphic toxin type 44 domain-containing protein [Priestia endophytica]